MQDPFPVPLGPFAACRAADLRGRSSCPPAGLSRDGSPGLVGPPVCLTAVAPIRATFAGGSCV